MILPVILARLRLRAARAAAVGRLLFPGLLLVLLAAPAGAQDIFGFGGGSDQAQRRQAELNLKIQQMEGQMRQLNGQLEQLTFTIRQLQEGMQRMQKDYEFRLQEIENAGARRPAKRTEAPPARLDAAPSPRFDTAAAPPRPDPSASADEDDEDAAPGAGRAVASTAYPAGPPRSLGAPPQVIGQIPASEDPIGGVIGGPGAGPLDLATGRPVVTPEISRAPPPPANRQAVIQAVPPRYQNVPPVASARDEYDAAYGYILNGEYELAETSFRTFLANHPTDRRVGNAQYWLGETYFARSQFRESADAFLKSYTQHPDGPKAADSLLKLGLSLNGLGERKAACATYDELLAKYPKSSKQVRDRASAEKSRARCG